MTFFEPIFIYI